jgi:hypothetical protein
MSAVNLFSAIHPQTFVANFVGVQTFYLVVELATVCTVLALFFVLAQRTLKQAAEENKPVRPIVVQQRKGPKANPARLRINFKKAASGKSAVTKLTLRPLAATTERGGNLLATRPLSEAAPPRASAATTSRVVVSMPASIERAFSLPGTPATERDDAIPLPLSDSRKNPTEAKVAEDFSDVVPVSAGAENLRELQGSEEVEVAATTDSEDSANSAVPEEPSGVMFGMATLAFTTGSADGEGGRLLAERLQKELKEKQAHFVQQLQAKEEQLQEKEEHKKENDELKLQEKEKHNKKQKEEHKKENEELKKQLQLLRKQQPQLGELKLEELPPQEEKEKEAEELLAKMLDEL